MLKFFLMFTGGGNPQLTFYLYDKAQNGQFYRKSGEGRLTFTNPRECITLKLSPLLSFDRIRMPCSFGLMSQVQPKRTSYESCGIRACLASFIWGWNQKIIYDSKNYMFGYHEIGNRVHIEFHDFHPMPKLNSFLLPYHFYGFAKWDDIIILFHFMINKLTRV
jgi:hypothetical protein